MGTQVVILAAGIETGMSGPHTAVRLMRENDRHIVSSTRPRGPGSADSTERVDELV